MSSHHNNKFVLLGRFGAPHGVRGEIRLQSFTGDPAAVAKLFPLTDASGARAFALRALRPLREDMFVAAIDGVNDRTAAEKLTNLELFADRAKFPAAADDEFYIADLVGLDAVLENGASAGRVVASHNFGAGDILEIASASGETTMLPFTRACVPVVDIANGKIVVSPPAEIEAREEDGSGA